MDDLFKIDINFPVPGFSCLPFMISFRWSEGLHWSGGIKGGGSFLKYGSTLSMKTPNES